MTIPNQREIDEAVLYIDDALTYLAPMEDDEAIEALLVARHFLTGEQVEYTDLGHRDDSDDGLGVEPLEGEYPDS